MAQSAKLDSIRPACDCVAPARPPRVKAVAHRAARVGRILLKRRDCVLEECARCVERIPGEGADHGDPRGLKRLIDQRMYDSVVIDAVRHVLFGEDPPDRSNPMVGC